jgi:hypothetical protein
MAAALPDSAGAALSEHALEVSEKVESEAAVAEVETADVVADDLDRKVSHRAVASGASEERAVGGSVGRYHDERWIGAVSEVAAREGDQADQVAVLLGLAAAIRPDDVDEFRRMASAVVTVFARQEALLVSFFLGLYDQLAASDALAMLGTTAGTAAAATIAFVDGLLEGAMNSGILDEATRERMLAMEMDAILYLNVFHGVISTAGAVFGILREGWETIVGFAALAKALTWDLDQTADMVSEVLAELSWEAAPDLAHDVGVALGEGLFEPIVELSNETRVIPFTFNMAAFLGPFVLDIVITFTGVGNLAKTAYIKKVYGLLRPLFEKLDADFVRKVEKAAAAADAGAKDRLAKAIAALDKDSDAYEGYLRIAAVDTDGSKLARFGQTACCGLG